MFYLLLYLFCIFLYIVSLFDDNQYPKITFLIVLFFLISSVLKYNDDFFLQSKLSKIL